jgi:hypothetical protein
MEGEVLGMTPAMYHVLPHALEVITEPSAPAPIPAASKVGAN